MSSPVAPTDFATLIGQRRRMVVNIGTNIEKSIQREPCDWLTVKVHNTHAHKYCIFTEFTVFQKVHNTHAQKYCIFTKFTVLEQTFGGNIT